uniref:ribosomal RNA-processing protein 7 homolog A-like n=1 Tax=Styela clava TaxID=7725 RepID=UPI0019394F6A|nr:ribosomal RNA-processing protein 7 homolog A-like [Styela clava]
MDIPPSFCCIRIKFDDTTTCVHDLLYKENKTRTEDINKPKNRTLLVTNVPPYCTEGNLRRYFSKFGEVENVTLERKLGNDVSGLVSKTILDKPTIDDLKFFQSCDATHGFCYAFVVFKDTESLTNSLRGAGKPINKQTVFVLSNKEKPVAVGMKKWVRQYIKRFPNKSLLQNNIDKYMENYDTALQKATEKEENAAEEADEDGWVKVTRKGKNPVIARTEANQLKAKAKEKMRRKRKDLLNSYSYQIRESKREKIAELRKKFEEDKERVQQMRDSRRFRPF